MDGMGRIASMVTSINRSKMWKMPSAIPNARPTAPPIESPANAEISVSRVAVSIEPSWKASTSATAMALGGASESLCR
jgi:hypothetical protein